MGKLTFAQHAERALRQEAEGAFENDNETCYAWGRAYHPVIAGRRPMITTEGYFGWAPSSNADRLEEVAAVGDVICVLIGCSTPLIIRPAGSKYRLVGECYLHGIMEGEVLKGRSGINLSLQNITFC
jgi:hypothetical protein